MAEFLLFSGAFPLRAVLLRLSGMNVSGGSFVQRFCFLAGNLALLAVRKITHLVVISEAF